MSIVGLLVRRNVKWILAFAVIFAYASGVLANASGLSQRYSAKLTEEFLDFTHTDFVVSHTSMPGPDIVGEVRGRLEALEEVKYVISTVSTNLQFSVSFEYGGVNYGCSGIWVYLANGTRVPVAEGFVFVGFLGLRELTEEYEPEFPWPEPGTVTISQDIAQALNMEPGENLTMETSLGNLTFPINAITDLNAFTIWMKIQNPQIPSSSLPKPQYTFRPQWSDVPIVIEIPNNLILVSSEDAVDLCMMFKGTFPRKEIMHYVFCDRKKLVEPMNMDGTIRNLNRVQEKIEILTADLQANTQSFVLPLFTSAAPEINLFSIIENGYMLAALPLYWFVASTLATIFIEKKRREVALFRVKGMSTRNILFAYLTVVIISAVLGTALGTLLQTNIVEILIQHHGAWSLYSGEAGTFSGIVFPDGTTFITFLVLNLTLALLAVWKMTKSIASLQPTEAIEHLPEENAKSKRLGKLPILLLALGLVKVGLVLSGLDSTVYFKHPPPHPYMSMALSLFATFDLYALTALAPVFIAYGFARLVSAKPKIFSGLLKVLSFLAGLRRRKISFRMISSEMWRASASLLLVGLVVSYGVASYVSQNSLADHVWRMAGEFTGSDMRIDCLPSATQQVEAALKDVAEVLNYARIDVVISLLNLSSTAYEPYVSLMALDPEQYIKTAYLDSAPELRLALSDLEVGSVVGLRGGLGFKYWSGMVVTHCPFPTIKGEDGRVVYEMLKVEEWIDLPLLGAIEDPETLNVSTSLSVLKDPGNVPSVPREVLYKEFLGRVLYLRMVHDLPVRLGRYTFEGVLWGVGEFAINNESLADIEYEHLKTHFILKLKQNTDIDRIAAVLREKFSENAMVITRGEATGIITRSIPQLAFSLAFTQVNCMLITAISLGGLVVVAIVNAAGRSKVLSLLRTRGAKKLDVVALFLPEAAFVSLLAGVIGVAMGLLLAVGFHKSIGDSVPSLFTGGGLLLVYGWITWLFVCLALGVFASMHIIATVFHAKISKTLE